jgi:two-component system chemotaxis response regulator CheY
MAIAKIELKIVVVDDSELSRKSMAEILSTNGFNVVGEANSAESALKLSVTTGANLFIIDVVMPEISGIELARFLIEQGKDLYIMMISSLTHESIVIESISNGAVDFLQKPFDPKDLLQSVRKISAQLNPVPV